MNERHAINIRIKWFYFEMGWFPGNPFRVIGLQILEITKYRGLLDYFTVFSMQVTYFGVDVGFSRP